MTTFNRGNFTQLWIRLTSDEPLGVLDTDYLEDYYGNDGFITLYNPTTLGEFQLAMLAVPDITPNVPNDVFQGVYSPLSDLVDGTYELRFRCRDLYGNYTISNSVQSPVGDERVLALAVILITVESPVVIGIGVHARLGLSFHVQRNANLFNVTRRGIIQ